MEEKLQNGLKHSEATNTKILLVEKKNKLYLSVQDNGKGFDKSQIIEKNGLGINQIHARIHMMKGKFVIESQKGIGTLIKIDLPIKNKKLIS